MRWRNPRHRDAARDCRLRRTTEFDLDFVLNEKLTRAPPETPLFRERNVAIAVALVIAVADTPCVRIVVASFFHKSGGALTRAHPEL